MPCKLKDTILTADLALLLLLLLLLPLLLPLLLTGQLKRATVLRAPKWQPTSPPRPAVFSTAHHCMLKVWALQAAICAACEGKHTTRSACSLQLGLQEEMP